MGTINVAKRLIKALNSACVIRIRLHTGTGGTVGPYGRMRAGQVKFPSAVEAHFVGAVPDREHTAEVTVPAAKQELNDTQEEFH